MNSESTRLPYDSSPDGPRCAIVLAGRRSTNDPLAKAAGASHRALLDIEGEPMLLRVVERLNAWPTIQRILINIDEPALLHDLPDLMTLHEKGVVEFMKSTDSPSRSVMESLVWADLERGPVLVTTADHALLDDEMLGMFFRENARIDADLTFGLVSRTTIEARFPDAKRTYLRFRDGAFSGANLFLFRTPNAERTAAFWRRVESERKHPWRIARAFGIGTLLLFLTRRLNLDAALVRASKVIGARVQAIRLSIAEAAVDVDKIEDLELVRRILAERRNKAP
jgi:GTP:adenosylcobinamide-phosphate guanylyltransferase